MSVSTILAEKGNAVVTIGGTEANAAAIARLAEHKIGALVVLDSKGGVCGILSERDIVLQLAETGASALEATIGTCMTRNVISCSLGDSIDTVMEKMTHGRFRHLPVIENEKLEGIISIGDVVKRKIQLAEREADDLKSYIAG